MTEKDPEPHLEEDDDELDGKLNYKPPPQKSLKELQEMDKDDESLIKYKKTLLGDGPVVAGVCLRGRGAGGGSQAKQTFQLLRSWCKAKSHYKGLQGLQMMKTLQTV